jgi:hypothetical protein
MRNHKVDPFRYTEDPLHPFADVGFMRNLGRKWAAGANLHVEDDAVGAMLRGRRWLWRSLSVDVATGFLNPHDRIVSEGGIQVAWVNQAQLNLFNIASVVVQSNTWGYHPGKAEFSPSSDKVESGTGLYVGGSLQYIPSVVGALVAVGVLLALVRMPT